MEKQDSYQLELFSEASNSMVAGGRTFDNAFMRFIRNYEKTLLVIIGIVITSIISFSLGVEKGKAISLKPASLKPEVTQNIRVQPTKTPPPLPAKQVIPERPKDSLEGYTIQLASYRTKASAQKEAEALKKRGFSALVISKGSYAVLCVGKFANKENARTLLSQFEKRYRGCYIRRL
jgi:septal ring-binding cell division protein DamX